eukprot:1384992-Rhodomonas_salina.2
MRVDFDLHQSSSDRRPRHDSSSSQPERRNLLDLLSQRQELPAAPLPYDELEPPPPPRGRRSIPGPACDQHAEDGTSAITLAAAQAKPRSEEDLGPIPTLPLRKHRPIPERNDPDFHGAPWMKMLQDLVSQLRPKIKRKKTQSVRRLCFLVSDLAVCAPAPGIALRAFSVLLWASYT